MKKRLFNVIKIFLMILGVLFLMQLLLFIGAVIGLTSFSNMDLNILDNNKNGIKEMKPIINYVEDFRKENNEYPEKIDSSKIKIKPNLYFEYETEKDNNCYSIILKNKKNNNIKQYHHCSIIDEKMNSNSESYVEFSE